MKYVNTNEEKRFFNKHGELQGIRVKTRQSKVISKSDFMPEKVSTRNYSNILIPLVIGSLIIGLIFTFTTNNAFSIKALLIRLQVASNSLYTPQEIFKFQDYSNDIVGKALELKYFDNPLRLDNLGKLLNYRLNEYGVFLKDLGNCIYKFFQNVFTILNAIF